MDEISGNEVLDSTIPLRHAKILGQDANQTRASGFIGNGLSFDGTDDWLNLDPFGLVI